jgi:serine/threonine protein phosphatase PrpC
MSLTSTVAGLALGFATETGSDYFNDTLGAVASDLAFSGPELVSGDHFSPKHHSQVHRAPQKLVQDARFALRAPLASPVSDLALTASLPMWNAGLGSDIINGLGKQAIQHISDWDHSGPLRFYGEPLALLALLGVGGLGTATVAAGSLVVLSRRGRSRVQGTPVPIQEQAIQILADEALRGRPQNDPIEGHVYTVATPTARVVGGVTYGGPGSKYDQICEDSMGIVVRADGSLVAFVFDGAGGSGGGFRATQLANESMMGAITDKGVWDGVVFIYHTIVDAVSHANTTIYEDNLARHGSVDEDTAAILYAYGAVAGVEVSPANVVTAVGVADSRVITLRGGQVLAEGTTDLHNYAQEQVDQGLIPPEEYYTHPMNNMITKDVGMHEHLDAPSVKVFQAQVGDLCVIVSDGVVDVVTLYEIAKLSQKHKTARALQKAIFDLAYQRNNSKNGYQIRFNATTVIDMPDRFGYGDNIAVAVVRITAEPKSP